MTVCRAFVLLAVLIAAPGAAYAQFGGMPGMPGSPGTPGMPGASGFGAPRTPPPACQELLSLRDEVQKKANAIQKASKRRAPPSVACKLFRTFLSSESKMIKAVDRNGPQCGVPSNVPGEMKKGHASAEKIAKQVCEAAAQGARPPTPSLSDAFGGAPVMPSDSANKARGGAFDTLTGNALAR
jgi:hypothetical protein